MRTSSSGMRVLTNRDLVYPRCFKWYKDSYTRSGHYKYFKYPSPASEDPHKDADNLDNYRTPYKYSIHNVRKDTILNEEHEYYAYLDYEALSQTTEQK